MKRKVVYVDKFGLDENGEDYTFSATDKAIKQGYMMNIPVTLVYPDGRREDRNKAMVTKAGIRFLAKRRPWEGGTA